MADLRRLAKAVPAGDYLRFELTDPQLGGGQGADHMVAQVKVVAFIGVAEYGRFPVDLSLNQRVAEPVERVRPHPVVELPGSDPLPEFLLYPLAEQIADKVCAMYSRYGREQDQPSTRYRDLVDIAIIVTHRELEAVRVAEAVRDEAERRDVSLPDRLIAPSPQWRIGYRQSASGTILPPALQELDGALAAVGICLEPLLAGTAEGLWDPLGFRWN